METNKETIVETGKTPKSPTRYPKRMNAYIVALAVQGTLDDPQKVEQITTNRSADSTYSNKSSESISPTNSTSTKTFTISPSAKLSSVLNVATLNEVKIDIVDESQCGDVTEKKSSQLNSNGVINQETADEQPEIIESAKNFKRCKENNKLSRKKPRKSTMQKIQYSEYFKYKKRKNCTIKRLEKCYENEKLNTPNSEQIQAQIYCNHVSQVVSRSRILQKVVAKENSLDDADRIPSYDDVNFDYDDDSLSPSPSRSKKSFMSYTSQKTLVNIESQPSRNDKEHSSPKTANSIIQVTSDKEKSEIIKVSLVINASNTHADQMADNSSNEKLMHKVNLTSSETFLQNNSAGLTSKPTSSDDPESFEIDYNELTLIQKDKSNASITKTVKTAKEKYSEDDSFVVARTISDFNKSSITSSCTLQINSGSNDDSENIQSSSLINKNSSDISKHNTLLDRVKSLGFYLTKAPSIDSYPNNACESKNVLVTDNVMNSLSFTKDAISCDDHLTDVMKTSVLRKPIELKNMNYFHNNFVLPDNIAVKAELNAREEIKRSCADNVTNLTGMGEVWERVALVLDLAVKRLEETLVERIINNIKESLSIFNQPEYKVTTAVVNGAPATTAPVNNERSILTMKNKGVFVKEEHLKLDVDVCVQCDLVQKQVIDQLVYQLSSMPKPIPASEKTFKILKPPELVKDYTEVLKPPVAHVTDSFSVEEGKGDTATASTATTELSATSSFRVLRRLFSCSLGVLRENAVILTSVPTFFIVLFCLYGVIVILMKPW